MSSSSVKETLSNRFATFFTHSQPFTSVVNPVAVAAPLLTSFLYRC